MYAARRVAICSLTASLWISICSPRRYVSKLGDLSLMLEVVVRVTSPVRISSMPREFIACLMAGECLMKSDPLFSVIWLSFDLSWIEKAIFIFDGVSQWILKP